MLRLAFLALLVPVVVSQPWTAAAPLGVQNPETAPQTLLPDPTVSIRIDPPNPTPSGRRCGMSRPWRA